MYVNIRIFISVDFIFITTSSFRGGRQQLIYLLFVNLSSLLLPRVHIQVKFLQCTFCFCTVCVVLKQRFWRRSQCRRHIYLLVNENKVSNFQNKWCSHWEGFGKTHFNFASAEEKHYPSQTHFQSRKIKYGIYAD